MQPLDLHVEDEARVELDALMLLDDARRAALFLQLDRVELLDGHLIQLIFQSGQACRDP